MRIYALCCGYLEFDRSIFFPGDEAQTRMTIPVPSYLLIHPKGNVLFDTGVHCSAVTDPVGRLGKRLAERFAVRSHPGDDVVSQLSLIGVRSADITYVINSHLHFDHIGGNEFFPQATFLVQECEMESARSSDKPTNPNIFDHPLNYHLLEGEHDLFGDGKLVLIPTYGHTRGHQSLWVRMSKATQFVLTADACYTQQHMDREVLPQAVWDAEAMLCSLNTLRNLRDKQEVTLFYGHDPSQWQSMRRAPNLLV